MDEQRYVVEITRPVPPEKVGQVAQRIAERLSVPVERIVTLLEGRVGEVTKPVLAAKAYAIAEVFAEAGVRVDVAAARIDPPHYEERFGEPIESGREAGPPGDAYGADVTGDSEVEEVPGGEYPADEFPVSADPADDVDDVDDEYDESDEDDVLEHGVLEHGDATDASGDDEVPWGQEVTWGFDSAAAQEWTRPGSGQADDEDESEYEPYEVQEDSYDGPYEEPVYAEPEYPEPEVQDQPEVDDRAYQEPDIWPPAHSEPSPTAHVPEEEADRLGPTPRPLRVEYEDRPETLSESEPQHEVGSGNPGIGTGRNAGEGGAPTRYAASTRWTPSPHDPYAFAPEDAPGFEGRRTTPMGPARTTPLSAGDVDRTVDEPGVGSRDAIGGFFSPEEEPREGPQLRVYLLWALAISLLVLILLQFVMALRVDGSGAAVAGAFEAGLLAYRKGDFGAARSIWEPVADAGNAQAQYFLGFMLQNGLGQPWSNARAANWYRRAAHQGLPEAQLALGDLYLRGMGVELDPRVGAAWYASAAVTGDPDGQFEYAKLLLHGVGVEQDMNTALAWFEAAAANGHEAAADFVAYANAAPATSAGAQTESAAQE